MYLFKYFFAIILFSACTHAKKENIASAMVESVSVSENRGNSKAEQPSQKQIIVKTATIDIRSEKFSESERQLKHLMAKFEMLIQDQRVGNDNYSQNGAYILRVPAAMLEVILDSLKLIGIECSKNELKSEDVTAEYTDTELRIKTKYAIYAQYLALIKQAKNVEEVLHIQESARVLQEEIESMEGRIKFLNTSAAYSTINLTIVEYHENIAITEGFLFQMKKQFFSGYELLKDLLLLMVKIWPLIILIGLLFFARKKIKRFFAGKWNIRNSV